MQLFDLDFIKKTEERNKDLDEKKMSALVKMPASERALLGERLDHVIASGTEPLDVAKERIIDNSDLMSINFLELGLQSAKSVCRIHVRGSNGSNKGYGTGFLVSHSLVLTNNHVFESEDDAVNSMAEFDYQYDIDGNPAKSYLFEFDPQTFFATNTALDYSLVAIKPISKSTETPITDFGYLKLFKEPNKALLTEHVSIIQHPGGGYKQIAVRENKVVSKTNNFISYVTDTAQGSSGSPVFNDQWQVVALHHSGVPQKDDNGNIVCKDGSIYRSGMDDSLIAWISNEGIRISAILSDLDTKESTYLTDLFALPPYTPPQDQSTNTEATQPQNTLDNHLITSNMNNKITFTIPIEISVGIGNTTPQSNHAPTSLPSPPIDQSPAAAYVVEKALDQKYSGRKGYDQNFVKAGEFSLGLADLLKKKTKNLAPILNPSADNKYFLHYHNFSVAMHKERKLCIMTAVNIDGNRLNPLKRENTKWILDPRMDKKYQTGPYVYDRNDLDRGHMVRRLDPVWGKNATAANDDTFHFTNSTPQHKDLNQKTWLSLENYILDNADNENIKASVFTGPIFSDEDIPYRDVLLPLQFWKVAAMIKKDGKPSVTGYVLKQPDNIDDFRDREGISQDGYGKFKTYQVSLQTIADLTGIAFDKYNQYDPLQGTDTRETISLLEITDSTDIKL